MPTTCVLVVLSCPSSHARMSSADKSAEDDGKEEHVAGQAH